MAGGTVVKTHVLKLEGHFIFIWNYFDNLPVPSFQFLACSTFQESYEPIPTIVNARTSVELIVASIPLLNSSKLGIGETIGGLRQSFQIFYSCSEVR